MTNPVFPTMLPSGQVIDSSKFGIEYEDPSLKTEMDGGYTVSRAKHTRTPRRTFQCAYTSITTADKVALENFWGTVRGGSLMFDWTNPQDGTVYTVRFKGTLKINYAGRGNNQLWDAAFMLEQV